jgi:hypothetical protein
MVNLERMLRELIQSQLGKAQGHAVPPQEQVVEVETEDAIHSLAVEQVDHGGDLGDRHIESRLNVEEKFNSQVSHLPHADTPQFEDADEARQDALASDIMRLLREPGGPARAVILAEIINRPTHRW